MSYEVHYITLSLAEYYNLTGWGICNCKDKTGRAWYLKADFKNKWPGNQTEPTGPPTPNGSEVPMTVTNFNDLNNVNPPPYDTWAYIPNPPNPKIAIFISVPDLVPPGEKYVH